MKGLLAAVLLCCLAAEAPALEITSAVKPAAGGGKADIELSGLLVRNVSWEGGAVVMPATEQKGRVYADVKLLSRRLYASLEACFKRGCPAKTTAGALPRVKVEGLKPLKSKVRVANAEVSFDGELLAVMGVMASSREPGTFWVAVPGTLEFRDEALKKAVLSAVLAAWGARRVK